MVRSAARRRDRGHAAVPGDHRRAAAGRRRGTCDITRHDRASRRSRLGRDDRRTLSGGAEPRAYPGARDRSVPGGRCARVRRGLGFDVPGQSPPAPRSRAHAEPLPAARSCCDRSWEGSISTSTRSSTCGSSAPWAPSWTSPWTSTRPASSSRSSSSPPPTRGPRTRSSRRSRRETSGSSCRPRASSARASRAGPSARRPLRSWGGDLRFLGSRKEGHRARTLLDRAPGRRHRAARHPGHQDTQFVDDRFFLLPSRLAGIAAPRISDPGTQLANARVHSDDRTLMSGSTTGT